jgi:hypothetical protein
MVEHARSAQLVSGVVVEAVVADDVVEATREEAAGLHRQVKCSVCLCPGIQALSLGMNRLVSIYDVAEVEGKRYVRILEGQCCLFQQLQAVAVVPAGIGTSQQSVADCGKRVHCTGPHSFSCAAGAQSQEECSLALLYVGPNTCACAQLATRQQAYGLTDASHEPHIGACYQAVSCVLCRQPCGS